MLISSQKFLSTPVMSLQTGSELARTSKSLIDPYSLTIVAYYLEGPLLDNNPSLLRVADIREVGPMGIIIDSADELISPDDVIKIKDLVEINFNLEGLKIIDEKKHHIGKVIGYTIEANSFIIQQLRVKRPLLKSFGDVELLIHRSQIVKVSNDSIMVKSPTIRHTQPIESRPASFDNPFRQPQVTRPETTDS